MSNEKQVWLNVETGEFSDSWPSKKYDIAKKAGDLLEKVSIYDSKWKLIEYECKNDEKFEFNKFMRIS